MLTTTQVVKDVISGIGWVDYSIKEDEEKNGSFTIRRKNSKELVKLNFLDHIAVSVRYIDSAGNRNVKIFPISEDATHSISTFIMDCVDNPLTQIAYDVYDEHLV